MNVSLNYKGSIHSEIIIFDICVMNIQLLGGSLNGSLCLNIFCLEYEKAFHFEALIPGLLLTGHMTLGKT